MSKVTAKNWASLPEGLHKADTGLFLKVRGEGRFWIFKMMKAGRLYEIGVGSAKKMGIQAARERAIQLRAEITAGTYKPRQKAIQKKPKTVAEIIDLSFQIFRERGHWSDQYAKCWIGSLHNHVTPALGSTRCADVTKELVIKFLSPLWKAHPQMASIIAHRMESVFVYATFIGEYNRPNPFDWKNVLSMVFPPARKAQTLGHFVAPTPEELRKAVQALSKGEFTADFPTLFGILTACRSHEVANAIWTEIDIEKRIFSISPERRKVRKDCAFSVPLSDQALAVLSRIEDKEGYIFKNPITGKQIDRNTLRRRLKLAIGRENVTMHGCRSTFRDWCAERGEDPVLAEKSLMHQTGNAVEQAYQRSDLLEKRRPLMQRWEDFLFSDK